MKNLLTIILCANLIHTLCAQQSNLVIGNSLAYIPIEKEINFWGEVTAWQHELSWNLNLGFDINNLHRITAQHIQFVILSKGEQTSTMYMSGISYQVNALHWSKAPYRRLYPELGVHYSNYCKCGLKPYVLPNLIFIGYGIGGGIPLSPKWDLDLAFTIHSPINKSQGQRSENIVNYVIGLDYYFKRRSLNHKKDA